jgi:hypothetical protein
VLLGDRIFATYWILAWLIAKWGWTEVVQQIELVVC